MAEAESRQHPWDRVLLVVPLTLLGTLLRRFPRVVTVLLVVTILDTAAMVAMPGLLGAVVASLTQRTADLPLRATALALVLVLPAVIAQLRGWFSQLLFTASYSWCNERLVASAADEAQKETWASQLDSWQFDVVHETVFTETAQRIMGLVAIMSLLRFDVWSVVVLCAGYRLLGRAFSLWRQSFYDLPPAEQELQRHRGYVWGLLTGRDSAAELRVFSMRAFLEALMARDAEDVNRRVWRKRGHGDRAMVAGYAVVSLGLALLLWRVLHGAVQGSVGADGIATMFGWLALAGYIGFLGDPEFFSANALKIYRELGAEPSCSLSVAASQPPVAGAPALRVQGLHFSYGETPVLHGVTLTIQRGERVAIVGSNGAGKTTLMRLILGDLTPRSGTIQVFGRAPSEARGQVGAVFQDFLRLPLTVEENVAAGSFQGQVSPTATTQALAQVGLAAAVADLPAGRDTILDPTQSDGVDLSGGQWQRVAMARALAREIDHDGDFLFAWDEPTCQLDPISEADILKDFTRITSGHACLVVTHRLGSVRHMDRVVVMADGVVAEEGTHEELMARKGHYWEMFTAQAENYRKADPDACATPA